MGLPSWCKQPHVEQLRHARLHGRPGCGRTLAASPRRRGRAGVRVRPRTRRPRLRTKAASPWSVVAKAEVAKFVYAPGTVHLSNLSGYGAASGWRRNHTSAPTRTGATRYANQHASVTGRAGRASPRSCRTAGEVLVPNLTRCHWCAGVASWPHKTGGFDRSSGRRTPPKTLLTVRHAHSAPRASRPQPRTLL